MFLTGTVGVVLGGPLALMLMQQIMPEAVAGSGSEEVWRGMTTIAGSWIGGGANQAAMFEIFQPSSRLYSIMITGRHRRRDMDGLPAIWCGQE